MADQDLPAVLERHQDALMAIPGVLGVALGRGADGPLIEVFVRPAADQDMVRRRAAAILAEAPVKLVPMHPPEAQGGF